MAISGAEVRGTKQALIIAMVDDAASTVDIGNFMQNLAYVEQVKGEINKAILFYEMTLKARETAEDARGYALTQARLAECYKELGEDAKAKKYGELALKYFKSTGDKERIEQVIAIMIIMTIFTRKSLIGNWLKFAQRN